MPDIKYYRKTQYGREDTYLIESDEARAIMKITNRIRTVGDYPISKSEKQGLEELGFKFSEVVQPKVIK